MSHSSRCICSLWAMVAPVIMYCPLGNTSVGMCFQELNFSSFILIATSLLPMDIHSYKLGPSVGGVHLQGACCSVTLYMLAYNYSLPNFMSFFFMFLLSLTSDLNKKGIVARPQISCYMSWSLFHKRNLFITFKCRPLSKFSGHGYNAARFCVRI